MIKYSAGDRIFSRRHRIGEIHVDIAGTKVLVGRAIKRDGSPSRREVVVAIEEITNRWPLLPGMRD